MKIKYEFSVEFVIPINIYYDMTHDFRDFQTLVVALHDVGVKNLKNRMTRQNKNLGDREFHNAFILSLNCNIKRENRRERILKSRIHKTKNRISIQLDNNVSLCSQKLYGKTRDTRIRMYSACITI